MDLLRRMSTRRGLAALGCVYTIFFFKLGTYDTCFCFVVVNTTVRVRLANELFFCVCVTFLEERHSAIVR